MTERMLPRLAPETLDPPDAGQVQGAPMRPDRRSRDAAGQWRRRLLEAVGAAAGMAALCAWLVLVAVHSNSALVNSDGATVVLQGQAFAHGNVLLEGWHLSLDSWWSLDVPFYAAATALGGVRPEDLFVVPAVIATLLVVLAVVLVRGGRLGRAGWVGAAVVVAVLALPSHMFAYMLLAGPVHQSTALFSLVTFAGLRRNRFGLGFAVAVLALAAGLLGDLQMLSYAVAPVALAGLVAIRRKRSARAAAVPLAASVGGVALALVVRGVVDLLGGFDIGPTNNFATAHQILSNLAVLPETLGGLLGVVPGPYGSGGVPDGLLAVHAVSAALLGVCLALAAARLVRAMSKGTTPTRTLRASGVPAADGAVLPVGERPAPAEVEPWRLDDMLLFAAIGSICTFVALARNSNPHFARYLTEAVVVSAVLTGREVARRLARRQTAGSATPTGAFDRSLTDVRARPAAAPGHGALWRGRRVAVHLLAAGSLLVAGCFVAGSILQVSQPVPPETGSGLASFLEQHHLDRGIGDYWLASITTVESGGHVVVRPVVPANDGEPEAYNKGEVPGWFAGVPFRFLVVTDGSADEEMARGAVRAWGRPSRRFELGGDVTVLVWPHPFHVSGIQSPR